MIQLNQDYHNKLFSAVIPVFNSGDSLAELSRELSGFFIRSGYRYEIIFIDDGSTDNSWEIIKEVKGANSAVKGIRLKKNFGQIASTSCGIEHASGDFIITMDDDLQFDPNEIKKLIDGIAEFPEARMVLGYPSKKQNSLFRKIFSAVFRFLFIYAFLPSFKKKNLFTSFRLMSHEWIKEIKKEKGSFSLLFAWEWNPREIQCIPVNHSIRKYGKSNYNIIRLIRTLRPLFIFISVRLLLFTALIFFITGIYFYSKPELLFIWSSAGLITFVPIAGLKQMLETNRKIHYLIDEAL